MKRFEDLIEEKMKEEGEDYDNEMESYEHSSIGGGGKKNFLKKGTRTFLSNA